MKLTSGRRRDERRKRALERLERKESLNERELREVAVLRRRTGRL